MPDFSLFGDEHVRQYEATDGKVGHDWNGTACLILHTTGRKSGQTRKFPLTTVGMAPATHRARRWRADNP